MNLLLVDQDLATLQLAKCIFTRAGHRVTLARNAHEAFNSLAISAYDGVLAHDNLACESSGELCCWLRAWRGTFDGRIVLYSAHDRILNPAYQRNAGADHFLRLPFLPRDLLNTVMSAFTLMI